MKKVVSFTSWLGVGVLGSLLAAGHDSSAQGTPEVVWATNAHYDLHVVAFSANSRFLVSGAQDNTVKVWNVTNTILVQEFGGASGAVLAVALSPDGSYVAAGDGDGRTQVWRVTDGVRLWRSSTSEDTVWALDVSPDGSLLAVGRESGEIDVRPVAEQFGGRAFEGHARDVYSVVFSPDGAKLGSASDDGTARIWQMSDGVILQTFTGHSLLSTNEDENVFNPVWSVDISPDGALAASSGADNNVRLWRVSDGTEVRVMPSTNCGVVKFSAGGKLLFTVNNGPISIWRVDTGQPLHTYADANAGPLAVAPNGKYFAYGRGDGAVVLAHVPLWVESIARANGAITLNWQGGSGLYQLQQRTNLTQGSWQNVGSPTTATTATNGIGSGPVFYRVQSLPNP